MIKQLPKQLEQDKKTNNGWQNFTQKTNDCATQTPLSTEGGPQMLKGRGHLNGY